MPSEAVSPSESISTVEQIESTPQGLLKRWLSELDLARSAEEDWRKESEEIWDLYRSKNRKANSFNILWSNTETLRPSLYNSQPRPDVRRRFRDPDPVGKVASTILERALVYSIDSYDFDHVLQETILDVLLPGRGVARVKYEPKFRPMAATAAETDEDWLGGEEQPQVEMQEELYDEMAMCAHVDWDTFLHGPGTSWIEVPWVSFEHCLYYDDLVKMFGKEIADQISLDDIDDKATKTGYSKEIRSLLKTAKVQEIWDREKKRVLFICEGYKHGPLRTDEDPLHLSGFFPLPRPVYAIEDSSSLIPAPLYTKYKPQAEELNRVTLRINKIVDALKVRGAYASNLAELAKIIEAADNAMLPIENASEVAALGGLDKAIWIMPIDKLVIVLRELYASRAAIIQSIYEITGLGDIMRGVSNPHETLGAQQLKSQWGTLRLQRLQREVQRFIRDMLRLKAEIIGEHFSPETLASMTGVQLPTAEQKQMIQQQMMQMQQAQQAAAAAPQGMPPPQPGAPPQEAAPQAQPAPQVPPELEAQVKKLLALPTWEDVMKLLKSDGLRQYRIDIETDSTVAETLQRDTQAMMEAITSVTNIFTQMGPAVQQGILTVDVIKQLSLAVTRNARMGQAVEDAIDQVQQPPPQPQEQAPPDHSLEIAQIKSQSDQAIAQNKMQMEIQAETARLANEKEIEAIKAQLTAHTTEVKASADVAIAKSKEESAKEIADERERTARLVSAAKEETSRENNEATLESKAEIQKDSDLLTAAVSIITANIKATGQPAEEATAEAQFEKQEATEGRKSLMKMMSEMVEGSSKANAGVSSALAELATHTSNIASLAGAVAKPRKVKFELDADGLPAGAVISSD